VPTIDEPTALSDAELAALRIDVARCKYQRGTQGVWARRVLALLLRLDAERDAIDDAYEKGFAAGCADRLDTVERTVPKASALPLQANNPAEPMRR
jgi:hypothetical protein